MLKRTRAAVLAVLWAAAATHIAAQRGPLPPFTVTALDGTAVDAGTLVVDGSWLLVHVQAQCGACDALLAQIDQVERPSAPRIVVVGGGMDQAAMAALAAKHPRMAASRWFADPSRAVLQALAIKTSPTVFGLRQSDVHWRLAGGVRNERELESILFTWLEKP